MALRSRCLMIALPAGAVTTWRLSAGDPAPNTGCAWPSRFCSLFQTPQRIPPVLIATRSYGCWQPFLAKDRHARLRWASRRPESKTSGHWPWTNSPQRGRGCPRPRKSPLSPLIHPIIHCFVPKLRILRLQHPMSFVRKIQHLRRHTFHLQRGEKLEAFAHIQPVIALAVDYESRRLEIPCILMRRPLLIHHAVIVGSAFELPVVEPEFLGSPPGGFGIEHAIVRPQTLESIGVPKYPVDGVSAVAGSQGALPVFVDERISLLRVVEPLHQILIRSAAPVTVDGVDELLPVAGRAVEVDHDDHISWA